FAENLLSLTVEMHRIERGPRLGGEIRDPGLGAPAGATRIDDAAEALDAIVVEFRVTEIVPDDLSRVAIGQLICRCDQIGSLAFAQVVAGRLTSLGRVAEDSEDVVSELERLTERQPVGGVGGLD